MQVPTFQADLLTPALNCDNILGNIGFQGFVTGPRGLRAHAGAHVPSGPADAGVRHLVRVPGVRPAQRRAPVHGRRRRGPLHDQGAPAALPGLLRLAMNTGGSTLHVHIRLRDSLLRWSIGLRLSDSFLLRSRSLQDYQSRSEPGGS